MTRRREVLGAALTLLLPSALGCDDDDVIAPTGVEEPAALFWDHLWTFSGTYAEVTPDAALPFPTDRALLGRIRFGQDGGPPVADVLEGAELVFELDGRLLVKPAGADAAEYYGADYRVVDDVTLRASVRKSIWFPYSYLFDGTSRSLLIRPEAETGGGLMELVLEIVQRTLLSGALDSAALRIAALVVGDPRVETAMDGFVFDLVNGTIASIPIRNTVDATAYVASLLRDTGTVGSDVPDADLFAAIGPSVDEIAAFPREGIARALVERLVTVDIVTSSVEIERVDRAVTFAFYRRALETSGALAAVRRVDLLLDQSS